MQKSFMARVAPAMVVALGAIFGFMMAGCGQYADIIQNIQNATPVASDFTITGLTATADGNPKTVNVRPKTGKSQGAITVYYEGISGTVYPKSANAPSSAGKYAVTFDVEEADGFNAANGLKAGTLNISVKTMGGNENKDDDNSEEDNTDDDNEGTSGETTEKPTEDTTKETTEETNEETAEDIIKEITEPFILVDFEDNAWAATGSTLYKNRKVNFNGLVWSISGITKMNDNDHYIGSRGIRFRGTSKDTEDINRLELESFLTEGIKIISFNYASYGTDSGGKLILYYQIEEEGWVKAGEVTASTWKLDGKMKNAAFRINKTGNIRFKIEKINGKDKEYVNLDNIIISY